MTKKQLIESAVAKIVRRVMKEADFNKKSSAASKVLQLMDKDYSYERALKMVLSQDKSLNKSELERELDRYV